MKNFTTFVAIACLVFTSGAFAHKKHHSQKHPKAVAPAAKLGSAPAQEGSEPAAS